MTNDEYIKFSLGANPIENGYIDNDGKYFIVKCKDDIENIKFSNQNMDFGFFEIHYLSEEEIRNGYIPEAIVIDQEKDIRFNNNSIIVMMLI